MKASEARKLVDNYRPNQVNKLLADIYKCIESKCNMGQNTDIIRFDERGEYGNDIIYIHDINSQLLKDGYTTTIIPIRHDDYLRTDLRVEW
jgi:hypothetical protein